MIFAVRYGEYIDYGVGHIGFYAEFSENRKEFVEHGLASLVLTAKVIGNVVDAPELMNAGTEKEKHNEMD